jgi:hypothetical protein
MTEEPPKKPGRGRKKGTPKTGGRQKGTPNKNSFSVRLALDARGFNLIDEMIALYAELQGVEKKMSFLRWMAEFVYPRFTEVQEVPTKDPLEPGKSTSLSRNIPTADLISLVKRDA